MSYIGIIGGSLKSSQVVRLTQAEGGGVTPPASHNFITIRDNPPNPHRVTGDYLQTLHGATFKGFVELAIQGGWPVGLAARCFVAVKRITKEYETPKPNGGV